MVLEPVVGVCIILVGCSDARWLTESERECETGRREDEREDYEEALD